MHPFVKTNHFLTVQLPSGVKTVTSDSPYWDTCLKYFEAQDWEMIESILTSSVDKTIKILLKDQLEERDGGLFVNTGLEWKKVPTALSEHLKESFMQGLDLTSWVNFAKRLVQNPSERSVNELFSFIKAGDFTLCTDGTFIAYKRIRSDYKDIYTGKFDNSPGTEVKVDRQDVDPDSNVTCSRGLHVAHFEYAKRSYNAHNNTDVLVYVSVCPSDVVAIPSDYSHQKMRCCRYKVIGVCDFKFESPRYSSEDEEFIDGSAHDDDEEYVDW
jgi:hypothetical protein